MFVAVRGYDRSVVEINWTEKFEGSERWVCSLMKKCTCMYGYRCTPGYRSAHMSFFSRDYRRAPKNSKKELQANDGPVCSIR